MRSALPCCANRWNGFGTERRCASPSRRRIARRGPSPRGRRKANWPRAPHLRAGSGDARVIFKTALYLAFRYSGFYGWIRSRRRRQGRAAILLYHRVNDVSRDPLTTSTSVFAEHLAVLRRCYRVVPTSELVGALRRGSAPEPGSVAIHFDDCYRDVSVEAAALLRAAGLPAAMFIASGFIGTDRVFEHDAAKYPHRFENLRTEDIPRLLSSGFEIGAHTVNHANLGAVALELARDEVTESKRQLERLAGRPVTLFSFPFGKREHLQPQVRTIVENAGYEALFSAYGGFVSARSDVFDVPRIGVSGEHCALDLMMDLEGLSIADLARRLRALL